MLLAHGARVQDRSASRRWNHRVRTTGFQSPADRIGVRQWRSARRAAASGAEGNSARAAAAMDGRSAGFRTNLDGRCRKCAQSSALACDQSFRSIAWTARSSAGEQLARRRASRSRRHASRQRIEVLRPQPAFVRGNGIAVQRHSCVSADEECASSLRRKWGVRRLLDGCRVSSAVGPFGGSRRSLQGLQRSPPAGRH